MCSYGDCCGRRAVLRSASKRTRRGRRGSRCAKQAAGQRQVKPDERVLVPGEWMGGSEQDHGIHQLGAPGGKFERDGAAVGVADEDGAVHSEGGYRVGDEFGDAAEGRIVGGRPVGVAAAGEVEGDDAALVGELVGEAAEGVAAGDEAVQHEDGRAAAGAGVSRSAESVCSGQLRVRYRRGKCRGRGARGASMSSVIVGAWRGRAHSCIFAQGCDIQTLRAVSSDAQGCFVRRWRRPWRRRVGRRRCCRGAAGAGVP